MNDSCYKLEPTLMNKLETLVNILFSEPLTKFLKLKILIYLPNQEVINKDNNTLPHDGH